VNAIPRGMFMESEEQLIKRVGKKMFGDNVEFSPQVMELIKPIFRRMMKDLGQLPDEQVESSDW
jgi:hypothetical protein